MMAAHTPAAASSEPAAAPSEPAAATAADAAGHGTSALAGPPAPGASSVPTAEERLPVDPGLGFEKWMGFLSSFVAPLTLVTALLFYFGYVSTREFFRYFGVDVDIIGLSSQEFVMRSPGALFIPVMVLTLLAAAAILGHRVLRRRLLAQKRPAQRRVIGLLAWTGIGFILAGLVLAFLVPFLPGWTYGQLLTPLFLAIGAGLAAYASATVRALDRSSGGRGVVVLLVLVMIAGTFWSTATIAQWWGLGQARSLAADLTTLPAVVLDTPERLYPGNDAITFQQLEDEASVEDPAAAPQTFAYRYFGLRLLAQGGGRLYLVPDAWSPDASTLVVPYDDVRVRFRFVPDADPPVP
ncbi:hypothetical protein RS82_03998 [Microbacterium trichothecenolyticum]|uniref:Uncharacterized protein n=2 Tax=Microbacteriaceae TaxID=85023 RepID=A0A0M2H779_MICTR|nr:hypothetical protein RS82_03998 [Microbacterium trichothecenolyticum]